MDCDESMDAVRRDEWGFEIENEEESKDLTTEGPQNDPRSIKQWETIIAEYEKASPEDKAKINARKDIRKLVLKGIPHSMRPRVWKMLCGAEEFRKAEDKDPENPLFKKINEENVDDSDETSVHQIIIDLQRTFPTHKYISSKEGMKSLYNVLHAYAYYDKDVNYCQGMAFVAGTLLMIMSEEDAFWTMAALFRNKEIAGFYKPGMPGLVYECELFTSMLNINMPRLAKHIESFGVVSILYIVPWFIPLFTSLNNWALVMRFWDLFMLEGVNALRRIALALVTSNSEKIFTLQTNTLIPFLISPPCNKVSIDLFMKKVNDIQISRLVTRAQEAMKTDSLLESNHQQVPSTPGKRKREDDSEAVIKCTNSKEGEGDNADGEAVEEEETGTFTRWIRRALTPNSNKDQRRRRRNSADEATKTAIRKQQRLSFTEEPIVPNRNASANVSPKANKHFDRVTVWDGNTMSPASRSAFREFATPAISPQHISRLKDNFVTAASPVNYQGKRWEMTTLNPISPITMELSSVKPKKNVDPIPLYPNSNDMSFEFDNDDDDNDDDDLSSYMSTENSINNDPEQLRANFRDNMCQSPSKKPKRK